MTPNTSLKLLDAFNCSNNDQLYYVNPICLSGFRFVVALDDLPIYGGVSTLPASPLVFPYPIIYVSLTGPNGNVVLTILSGHPENRPSETPGWDVIKDERIKTIFSDLGKLIE